MVPYIQKYVEHLEKICVDVSSEAYRTKFPLIQYWKTIAHMLNEEFGLQGDDNGGCTVQEGMPKLSTPFWPRTNHGTGYKIDTQSMDNLTQDTITKQNIEYNALVEEMAEERRGCNEMFVDCLSEKERSAWNPLEDIKEGSFVLLNPSKESEEKHGKDCFGW